MADAIVQTKRCSKCGETKPLSEFNKGSRPDGFQHWCRSCQNEGNRRYYRTPKGQDRARRLHASEAYKASQKRYKDRNLGTEKAKAWRAVRHMIEAGRLVSATTLQCAHCPKQAEGYHHHLGYAKEHRLDVQPLCAQCHVIAEGR